MACLMVIQVSLNGENREGLKAYMKGGPAIIAQYGGEYMVRGEPLHLEGEQQWKALIISKWKDRDAALAFWNSPEYTELRKLREGTGDYNISLVDA